LEVETWCVIKLSPKIDHDVQEPLCCARESILEGPRTRGQMPTHFRVNEMCQLEDFSFLWAVKNSDDRPKLASLNRIGLGVPKREAQAMLKVG
jgi:hypothetical protein